MQICTAVLITGAYIEKKGSQFILLHTPLKRNYPETRFFVGTNIGKWGIESFGGTF